MVGGDHKAKWFEQSPLQIIVVIGAFLGVPSYAEKFFGIYGFYTSIAITLLCLIWVVSSTLRGRSKVQATGFERYYDHFPRGYTPQVLQEVTRQYRYLGVSFSTVADDFLSWRAASGQTATVRLLILDPTFDEGLTFQVCHELKVAPSHHDVAPKVQALRLGIQSMLHRLSPLVSASSHFHIRLHRQKLRIWMHLVDEDSIYCGFLRAGESGINCPVVLIGRQRHWSLYDHYSQEFDAVWDQAAQFDPATVRQNAAQVGSPN